MRMGTLRASMRRVATLNLPLAKSAVRLVRVRHRYRFTTSLFPQWRFGI